MRDKVIKIIKTMRGQAAIDGALGEKRCSFYLNDYADQLAEAVGYTYTEVAYDVGEEKKDTGK